MRGRMFNNLNILRLLAVSSQITRMGHKMPLQLNL
jgi:hypothetical protein